MSRFVSKADTRTIHAPWWDEGEEVVIKKLSYGDRQAIADRSMRMTMAGEGAPEAVEIAAGAANLAMLEVGIVSWTFQEGGKPVACTPANKRRLNPEDADFIMGEIKAFSPRRSADAQANFRDRAGDAAEE